MIEKKCTQCGSVFKTEKEHIRLCPDCKIANKNYAIAIRNQRFKEGNKKPKKKEKPKTKPRLSLIEATRLIEKYNREHKTCYTYGTFPKHLLKEE